MSKRLVAAEFQRGDTGVALELQRQHAHADQVAAVDALVGFGDHRFDAQQLRAFRGPVAAGAGAVFLAGEDDGWGFIGDVVHRGVIDRHLLSLVQRVAALDAAAVRHSWAASGS